MKLDGLKEYKWAARIQVSCLNLINGQKSKDDRLDGPSNFNFLSNQFSFLTVHFQVDSNKICRLKLNPENSRENAVRLCIMKISKGVVILIIMNYFN